MLMDRAILESNPHQLIEGLIIAAYAIQASTGYIYVRAEYPLAVARLRNAISQAREKGLLGDNILGSDFSFELIIFQGSGAFVCGEETALIASIEGKPGVPNHRPPYPATYGLYGKPTAISCVKTLSYVPYTAQGCRLVLEDRHREQSRHCCFCSGRKVVGTGLVSSHGDYYQRAGL